MVRSVLPVAIGESYRLSSSGMHQGIVMTLQSEFDGLRINSPGVLLEISRTALMMAEKVKNIREQKMVKPVSPISGSDSYHPFLRP